MILDSRAPSSLKRQKHSLPSISNYFASSVGVEASPPAEPPRRRSPELSLSTKVPDHVMRELRRRYANTGVTIRVQVLLALKAQGFEIDEDDLQDERKHQRR